MIATAQPELRGPIVTLRDPREADLDPLTAILHEPEVAIWWVGYDAARVRAEFLEHPETTRVIEVEGRTAGVLIVLRGEDPEYPTTIMHIFLGTAFRGRRIGEEVMALAIRHEFDEGITRITLDPNVKNEGAIRSYERLGFRRIGILRDYQVRPGGTLDDATMESETRKVMGRLNPHFRRFKEPVKALSGGQRQSVAIARA
ncbi:MAG: GNAT family N-acetyltransferase, partial [Actinobacteria bacterium]|nr:GNAT family N-acetyltransferase [Actinomycetota bacterium]